MPWRNASTMSLRLEFVELACQDGSNVSQLCRRFGISRETGYKWLRRFREAGERQEGLMDRSPRPHTSPRRTSPSVEEKLLDMRRQHPAWGARKIKAYLSRRGQLHLPSAGTIAAILRRGGQIDPQEARKHRPCQRFEHQRPNQLWQMDFKGYLALTQGGWCHPLMVLSSAWRVR
jgi:transposase-like protein